MSDMLNAALYYAKEFGFSVIPVKGKAKHLVQWSKYQSEKASEEQIIEWWSKWPSANIGIVTGEISGISVFDLDTYKLNDDQKAEIDKAFPIVATPIAISGSGGEHRYFEYHPDIPTKNDVMTGLDIKNNGGVIIAPPSVNDNGQYKWKQGAKVTDLTLRSIPDSYLKSIKSLYSINSFFLGTDVSSYEKQNLTKLTPPNGFYSKGRRDEDLFHAANCLIKGNADAEFARQTLELISNNLGKEFGPGVVKDKIDSVLKRAGRREMNISSEFREWVELTEGNFELTTCQHDLTLTNKSQKQALYMAAKRLCEKGVIEKYGSKRGSYRRVEATQYENWMDADYDPAKIKLLFGMDEYVDIFPGDLIVVAGVKNSGKTAVALNFIENNLNNFDCYYHSSELVKQTFKLRVQKSQSATLEEWSKVKMTSGLSMDNCKDRVVPNALNVFDYIEGDNGEFFKIPSAMARIHRALGDGIAVICLQKPSERNYARGGEGTKDKAALYLTIDKDFPHHVCRITECKAFKEEVGNPTDFMIKYKVAGGINLHPDGFLAPEMDTKYNGLVK